MCAKITLFYLLPTIFCLAFPQNYSEFFKKPPTTPNLTEIEENIKTYEKNFFTLYRKAMKPEEMLCAQIEKNIKSLQDIKSKYSSFDDFIAGGKINNDEFKKLLELRGDILFGKRNIDIAIGRLNETKKDCFNNSSQMENYYEEYRQKNKRSKEDIIKAVNHIVQMENGL